MTTQRWFGGKFNAEDFAQTQQSKRQQPLEPELTPADLRTSSLSRVQVVMNIRGSWDVLVFGPMRRVAEGVSREDAERIAERERRR
jgi:hypothetical protein